MAKRVHKLALGPDEDFSLLSLVCDDRDYRLCWALNEAHGYHFTREEDLELIHTKSKTRQHFALFSYLDEMRMIEYRIIRNQGEEGYFLEELRNIDYLVHIQGAHPGDIPGEFAANALQLDSVRFCAPADISRIRERGRLSLW